jgi:tetratricopeptide (TPR) repeat protein
MATTKLPAISQPVAGCVFVVGLLFLLFSEMRLSADLTHLFPIGGNDEPMHLSMARSIARHGQWPRWDSEELMRYYGVSYASASSFNYWIEGILQSITGQIRWSAKILFLIYLAIVTRFAVKCPTAGLIGLAALVPQVLFVFSYVNSDAWTAIVACLLGLATCRFHRTQASTSSVYFLFIAAALCLSCRPHMWMIGFITFMSAVLPNATRLLRANRRALVYSFLGSLVIASWWPVTSYFANNGDFIGRHNVQNEVKRFATLDSIPIGQEFESIDLGKFARDAATSFYGQWGWATISLPRPVYWVSLCCGLPLLILAISQTRKFIPLLLVLVAANTSLMLYGATQYNAMWQGRYLYPSYFVFVGIALESFGNPVQHPAPSWYSRILTVGLIVFLLLNGSSICLLRSASDAAVETMVNRRSLPIRIVSLLNSGVPEEAIALLRKDVAENPHNHRSLNLLGHVLDQQGHPRESRDMLEAALKISPADPLIRIHLGELDMREGHTDEAIRQFYQALVLNPRGRAKRNYLTIIHGRTSRWDTVMQACRDSLSTDPDNKHASELLLFLEQWFAKYR